MASPNAFWCRIAGLTGVTSLPLVPLVAAYLVMVYDLPEATWQAFLWSVAGWTGPAWALAQWRLVHQGKPLTRWLQSQQGGEPDRSMTLDAFRVVIDLPRRIFVVCYAAWWLGSLAIAAHMLLAHPAYRLFHASVLVAAAASAGLIALLVCALVAKRQLEGLRESLARSVDDVDLRETAVIGVPLLWKLRAVVIAVAVVPLVFSLFLLQTYATRPVEELVTRLQHGWLEAAAARYTAGGEATLEDSQLGALAVVDRRSGRVVAGSPELLSSIELETLADTSVARGDGRNLTSEHVFSWRHLDDEALVLVASIPWDRISPQHGAMRFAFVGVVATTASLALALAWLMARDLQRTSLRLREEADRLTAGDLRPGAVLESEDEVGALARSFERLAIGLRETVRGVADTAERVESAALEMEQVGASVTEVTGDQVRGIRDAAFSLGGMDERVREVAGAARELSLSVEESSSTTLELGATGEELRQTAVVLSEKADEVSSSVEEMIESVRQVADNATGLSQAAAEASGSMAEMASVMRQVDEHAAESSRLSLSTVAAAESGQEKVRLAMVGMETIQQATETAETVIQGLGRRVGEIGTIVGVIENVADETNLLALNAAIIAAQSGDQGRAFSVVANQIKDLANRVVKSTQEIAAVIRSVQHESSNAVRAIEQGSQAVASGVELSAQAGTSLEDITRAARESGLRIQEIVSSVREQASAAGHVAQLMEQVKESVEQIRQAAEEQERGNETVLKSTGTMREVAQQVNRSTDEQTRGTGQIRQGIEAVQALVEQIAAALDEQSRTSGDVTSRMGEIEARTQENEQATVRMAEAALSLRCQAEALRGQLARFQH